MYLQKNNVLIPNKLPWPILYTVFYILFCVWGLLQLQHQTRSQCCCLLLVSEDNHQLFCQVYKNRSSPKHTLGPKTHQRKAFRLTCDLFELQVVGDKVLEEEISFPVRPIKTTFINSRSLLTGHGSQSGHAGLSSEPCILHTKVFY